MIFTQCRIAFGMSYIGFLLSGIQEKARLTRWSKSRLIISINLIFIRLYVEQTAFCRFYAVKSETLANAVHELRNLCVAEVPD